VLAPQAFAQAFCRKGFRPRAWRKQPCLRAKAGQGFLRDWAGPGWESYPAQAGSASRVLAFVAGARIELGPLQAVGGRCAASAAKAAQGRGWSASILGRARSSRRWSSGCAPCGCAVVAATINLSSNSPATRWAPDLVVCPRAAHSSSAVGLVMAHQGPAHAPARPRRPGSVRRSFGERPKLPPRGFRERGCGFGLSPRASGAGGRRCRELGRKGLGREKVLNLPAPGGSAIVPAAITRKYWGVGRSDVEPEASAERSS